MTRQRPNWIAGIFSVIWLLIVLVPVYVLVKAAFQTQAAYSAQGPLSAPSTFTLSNFDLVFHSGFPRFFLNTAVITVAFHVLKSFAEYRSPAACLIAALTSSAQSVRHTRRREALDPRADESSR